MVGIRKLCTLKGGVSTGRRPYFQFANARYSARMARPAHRPARQLLYSYGRRDDAAGQRVGEHVASSWALSERRRRGTDLRTPSTCARPSGARQAPHASPHQSGATPLTKNSSAMPKAPKDKVAATRRISRPGVLQQHAQARWRMLTGAGRRQPARGGIGSSASVTTNLDVRCRPCRWRKPGDLVMEPRVQPAGRGPSPRNHPVVTRDYSLFTRPSPDMVDTVGRWIDDQVDGAAIFGPSRWQKPAPVDHWHRRRCCRQRCGGHVPMVVGPHRFRQLPPRSGASMPPAARQPALTGQGGTQPLDRQHMLIERWAELASQGGGRFLVLVIDEAQGHDAGGVAVAGRLHSLLEKERIRLCVFSVPRSRCSTNRLAWRCPAVRTSPPFILASAPFHGIRDVDELRFVLSGYDEGHRVAPRSGISFTAGLAPMPWADGFRMTHHAEGLMQAMVLELPARYEGPIEFPDEDGGTGRPACPAARRWRRRSSDVMSIDSWRRRRRLRSSGTDGHRDDPCRHALKPQRIACMTTGPSTRLTWHQGGVLPPTRRSGTRFSERVAERAAAKELAFCGRASRSSRRPTARQPALQQTGDGLRGLLPVEALSMRSLAQALGSQNRCSLGSPGPPAEVGSLAHFPGIRVCRTCMAAGYHSALHSLRLLHTCPIHGDELADRCNCGELFADDQVVLHHMNASYCQCGHMAFFTSQTCRRPTMRHDETAPMSMVAAWLERLRVSFGHRRRHRAQRAHDRILLDSVGAWCAEVEPRQSWLGDRPRPAASARDISVARLSTISAQTPSVQQRTVARARRRLAAKHSLYWADDDATTTYRSLARHIRRHVARGAEAHAIDFMLNPDPLQMGARMRAQRPAMVAFADLLFTGAWRPMRPAAVAYRDPRRVRPAGSGRACHLSVDGGHDWPPLREARCPGCAGRRPLLRSRTLGAGRRCSPFTQPPPDSLTGVQPPRGTLPAGAISSTHIDRPKPSGTAFWFDAHRRTR